MGCGGKTRESFLMCDFLWVNKAVSLLYSDVREAFRGMMRFPIGIFREAICAVVQKSARKEAQFL